MWWQRIKTTLNFFLTPVNVTPLVYDLATMGEVSGLKIQPALRQWRGVLHYHVLGSSTTQYTITKLIVFTSASTWREHLSAHPPTHL